MLSRFLLLVAGSLAGFAGAAAVLRAILPSRGDATSDELALVTIFDGVELSSRATAFRGGSIFTWFGGVSLDLREATLAPDARLDVAAAFGGVLVRVPPTWRVESDAATRLGGIDTPPPPDDTEAPVLVVRVSALAGGVSVSR